jgi:hypothetical protein
MISHSFNALSHKQLILPTKFNILIPQNKSKSLFNNFYMQKFLFQSSTLRRLSHSLIRQSPTIKFKKFVTNIKNIFGLEQFFVIFLFFICFVHNTPQYRKDLVTRAESLS